jgi:hypothetical protein
MARVAAFGMPAVTVLDGGLRDALRTRLYSAARVFNSAYRQSIVVDVEHAGEVRRIEKSTMCEDSRDVLRSAFSEALGTLDYLDDLRQGMRDLVDQ